MKAQVGAGNLVIAFVVFAFVLLGLFTVYSNFLVDNGATPDATIEAEINKLYADSNTQVDSAENKSNDLSTQFDSGDNIFIRGSKVLGQVKDTGVIALKGVDIAQKGTGETQLPTEFYIVIGSIITLLFVFAVAGALWKWDLLR